MRQSRFKSSSLNHVTPTHLCRQRLFNNKRRKTRKEISLSRMNELMPWDQLEAASSTKNKAKERDPEMHQTQKGKQWFFGL
tara:strand:- start:214 stop:456 length:243 start_codon:yes stop_codon:yes gene_type:complete